MFIALHFHHLLKRDRRKDSPPGSNLEAAGDEHAERDSLRAAVEERMKGGGARGGMKTERWRAASRKVCMGERGAVAVATLIPIG